MTRQEAAAIITDNLFGFVGDDVTEALILAVDALNAPDWISVKDRLPKPWETVLLWGHGEAITGYLADNGHFVDHRWGQFFTATHWMMHEPPKEELPHNRYYSGDGIASDRTEGGRR